MEIYFFYIGLVLFLLSICMAFLLRKYLVRYTISLTSCIDAMLAAKENIEFDEEMEYKIVGSTEADCLNGKISNESPVGVALIGSKEGDKIEIETPTGEMIKYEILGIKRTAVTE